MADTAAMETYPECVFNADILVHECAGLDDEAEKITASGHSAVSAAVRAARETGAKKLFLCHLPAETKKVDAIEREVQRLSPVPVIIPRLFTPYDAAAVLK